MMVSELEVKEDGRCKQIRPRGPLPDQEWKGDLDQTAYEIGRDIDQPVL